ncbi:MAG: hypothetical protein WDN69_33115 [Aliidongia sp.]
MLIKLLLLAAVAFGVWRLWHKIIRVPDAQGGGTASRAAAVRPRGSKTWRNAPSATPTSRPVRGPAGGRIARAEVDPPQVRIRVAAI